MKIPKGHQVVMPYLIIENASKFTDFAKQVFNAEPTSTRMREDNKSIMHSEIQIGGSTIMFCDATSEFKPATSNLFVYVEDADETYHKAVKAGSVTLMELTDQDYGRTCGVTDPFGNVWWITSVKD